MIDLAPEYLEIVKRLLRQHVPDRKVVAFGSRVNGGARRFSDLDICILGDSPVPTSAMLALLCDLEESRLPIKVDVVDWAETTPEFRRLIDGQQTFVIQNVES